ncbi:hypothetical protein ANCCEY_00714 [Ancylostoma ceylanicum]|uniref:Uncharacterized protein n=1 Tax=Ancylostoma ceylanicum TaxID=53326 RepID=A0A0D6M7L8_9BILA|nr:hypothetical protein ANCCEY_00714 [Ancylostoma ceylanicum]
MGNQTTRQLSTHRKHVMHSWNVIYTQNPKLLNDAISVISFMWLRILTPGFARNAKISATNTGRPDVAAQNNV